MELWFTFDQILEDYYAHFNQINAMAQCSTLPGPCNEVLALTHGIAADRQPTQRQLNPFMKVEEEASLKM